MRHDPTQSGFTLVEMAVALVVAGLVMLTILPAVTTMRNANATALTRSNLHNLLLATAAYVQANGCLPCPASAAVSGANFGRMNYASTATACGASATSCGAAEGIVPFVSLGIPAAAAHDGWGYWITMRVDTALTAQFNVVPPTLGCQCSDFISTSLPAGCSTGGLATTASCTALNASQKGFCRANLSSSGTYISVATPGGTTQKEAVVFVSHGTNGYGSCVAQPLSGFSNGYRLPFPSNYAACSTAGGYAECNGGGASCNAPNRTFYDAPQVVSNTDPYDDMLAYADRNTLVSLLGNGSCQTVW